MTEPTYSDRGFAHMPSIPSEYGGSVNLGESSAAEGPHLWLFAEAPANLNEPNGPMVKAPIHLTLGNAIRLRDQLTNLINNHWQIGE